MMWCGEAAGQGRVARGHLLAVELRSASARQNTATCSTSASADRFIIYSETRRLCGRAGRKPAAPTGFNSVPRQTRRFDRSLSLFLLTWNERTKQLKWVKTLQTGCTVRLTQLLEAPCKPPPPQLFPCTWSLWWSKRFLPPPQCFSACFPCLKHLQLVFPNHSMSTSDFDVVPWGL